MKLFKIFLLTISFIGINYLNSCNNNPADDNDNQPPCDNAQIGQWKSLGLENESITSIAINPIDKRIIYAGSSSDFSAGTPGRLFKSTDCGKTWNMLLSVGNGRFNAIRLNPVNPNIVYAIPNSIIKSTDGGLTWEDITGNIRIDYETRVASVEIDPQNPNILYTGTGGFFGGGLYKSTDAGNNWFWIGDSLRDGVASIAIDPNNTNVIYVGTAWRTILWKSSDSGANWERTGLQGKGLMYDILIDPADSKNIFAAITTAGIWKSVDNGNTWLAFNEGLPDSSGAIKIARQTDSGVMYIVAIKINNAGIYQRTTAGIWIKIGIDNINTSTFYYSDLKITNNNKYLYFGNKGIYIYRLQ